MKLYQSEFVIGARGISVSDIVISLALGVILTPVLGLFFLLVG